MSHLWKDDNRARLEAIRASNRTYSILVTRQEATDDTLIYVARALEVDGLSACGDTIEQATSNLKSAMADFFYFLLIDGLPIPEPMELGSLPIDCKGMV